MMKPTRRAVIGGFAKASVGLSLPGFVRSSNARPSDGVTFVSANNDEAETLSWQYNLAHSEAPQVRAICQTVDGAVQTIRWAQERSMKFALRSGGHCFAGTSNHPDLVIDLRQLNKASVDPGTRIMRAQTGAKLAELYRKTFPHKLAPAAGWCGDVGLGGHILGGGTGYLMRSNGLLCDNLKAATLIDAQGMILRCTSEENPELYWACRGGGGGLGLAVDFEIELQSVSETRSIRAFGGVQLSEMPALVNRWMQWSSNAPRETSSQMAIVPMSDGRIFGLITGLSTEPKDSLMRTLGTVSSGAIPLDDTSVFSGPFERVMEDRILSIPHFYSYSGSHSAVLGKVLGSDDLAPIIEKSAEARSDGGAVSFLLETLGGAIGDLAEGATAFPHRNGAFLMTAKFDANNSEHLRADRSALDDIGAMMWDLAIGRGYANYRDRTLVDYEHAYWGSNVDQLRAIKRRIDPDGVFNGVQTIRG